MTKNGGFGLFIVVPFNFLGDISISNWLILCFFLQEGGFFRFKKYYLKKKSSKILKLAITFALIHHQCSTKSEKSFLDGNFFFQNNLFQKAKRVASLNSA